MIDQIIQDIQQKGWSYQQQVVDSQALALLAPLFEEDFVPAKVGKSQERKRVEEIRGDYIKWLEPSNPQAEVQPMITLLNELKNSLNQNFYLGLKEFECHLARYPAGSFYKKHLDRFEKDSSRSFSFIFYLHESWTKQDGGELVLYNQNNEVIETILPLPGSMICFLSEEFPHEVKICHKERRSLTGWMHTKIIT